MALQPILGPIVGNIVFGPTGQAVTATMVVTTCLSWSAPHYPKVWAPTMMGMIPNEALRKADEHLKIEGGTAKVCFVFDVKDWKAQHCRVIVEGSRKDLT